jgi:predicted RNase H-like HicB family nuclease
MHSEYTAVVKNLDGWWIGWVEEVPGVNCQERTRTELMETLRETLREALEPFSFPSSNLGKRKSCCTITEVTAT